MVKGGMLAACQATVEETREEDTQVKVAVEGAKEV